MYAGFGRANAALTPRALVIQSLFLAAVTLLLIAAVTSARENLSALGLSSGFAFLDRATGWAYSFSLIENSIDDAYRRTLFIGFLNTLFVGAVSIVFATLLGFAIGAARDGRNFATKSMAAVFVQLFRNIPLILQAIFWYAVLIHMPHPRQAFTVLDAVFVSNRGVMLPWVNLSADAVFILLIAFAAGGAMIYRLKSLPRLLRLTVYLVSGIALVYAAHRLLNPPGIALLSIPELKGLRFRGGLQIPMELAAMLIAIVLYGAAYIAEVVQGGLREVPKGQLEAGRALGLSNRVIWFKVKLPSALAAIIPSLGNQWIFLMKSTTVGVAIGFSDLFMIVSTSITQSGQTLELIGILMAAFLLINFSLARLVNFLNRRFQPPGL